MATATAALLAALMSAPPEVTYASWSDFVDVSGNVVGAGVWAADPPTACGPVANYAAVVYGTAGDDILTGGNHPQIIMGLGGNDWLRTGNSGDCLVGGDGNDRLQGKNAKDVLIGGNGDDYLDGGNGQDFLDGGAGIADVCIGGNGTDIIVNCEGTAFLGTLASPTVAATSTSTIG